MKYSLVAYDAQDRVLWNIPTSSETFDLFKKFKKGLDSQGDCFLIDEEVYSLLGERADLMIPFESGKWFFERHQ